MSVGSLPQPISPAYIYILA
jgi:hypothetical protein